LVLAKLVDNKKLREKRKIDRKKRNFLDIILIFKFCRAFL